MNPFKFGTIVENDFFTDRVKELEEEKKKLDSENHLDLDFELLWAAMNRSA